MTRLAVLLALLIVNGFLWKKRYQEYAKAKAQSEAMLRIVKNRSEQRQERAARQKRAVMRSKYERAGSFCWFCEMSHNGLDCDGSKAEATFSHEERRR